MKVSELREKLKSRKKDELQQLIVEMYKVIPKSMRETKEIDRIIENPDYMKNQKKSIKQSIEQQDFPATEQKVQVFIKNAYAQYYVAPNRIVPKKERSNWRFTAKRLIDQVAAFSSHPEHQKASIVLYEEMYKLFCYASGHYVFTSEEPFYTLKISQEDFLKRVILLKKEVEEPDKWISDSLKLALENGVDYQTLTMNLLEVLLETLNNAPLKERAIEIANNLLQEKQSSKSINFQDKEYINHLVEMIFITQSILGEYEKARGFFKQNYIHSNKEVLLYILLRFIIGSQRVVDWTTEYELAVQKGIKPRGALQKTYEYIKRENKLPEYILNF